MLRTSTLVACLLLALTGCGSDSAADDDEAMIDWDLSQRHTLDDVDWPKPDLSAVEISPVDDVRIALPDGRSFESDGDTVHDITLDRRGANVRNVQIDSHPRSAADAHELAVLWAEEWDLSREPLDRWRDGAAKTPAITSGRPVERIGDVGPVPIVEIRNSFQDESPALVSLQFYWPE